MVSHRSRPLWTALTLVLLIQAVIMYQMQGPRAKSADAPRDEFSAARAVHVLIRLLGDESPHPTGSDANDRVRERLVAELEKLGLTVEIQATPRGPKRQGTLYNVLARLPDTPETGRPLVLATHYDSVSAGPGAGDAGCCVATLIETARALQQGGPYVRPIYLLITDGEEAGLLGADAFVKRHPLARRKPFVMNFEARGSSGPSMMYETHHGNLESVKLLARNMPRPCVTGSSFVTIYRLLPNDTDLTVFQRNGWTGLNFAFIGDAHNYHTPNDTLENLDWRSVQHHGDNAFALARAIATDADLDLSASDQDAVFVDLLGTLVVWVPQSRIVPIALLTLFVITMTCGRRLLCRVGIRVAAITAIAMILALFGSGLIGWCVARGLTLAGLLPHKYVAHSGWITAAYWVVSAGVVWGVVRPFFRRQTRHELWAALWLGFAMIGLVVAWLMPGFSYLWIMPALGTAVISLLPLSMNGKLVLSVAVATGVLLPLANLLPVALGARAGMLICPVFVFVLSPLYPFFGRVESPGPGGSPNSDAPR